MSNVKIKLLSSVIAMSMLMGANIERLKEIL